MTQVELDIIAFATSKHWARWLAKHHARPEGIWLRLFKKDSGVASITYSEALDEALCYGWIDGQTKKHDDLSWLRKFTPRRARSVWSKRNREHIARLTKAGRMQPAGLRAVEAAKADGRWDQAYDSPGNMVMPADFLALLAANKKAHAFFQTLNKANTYAIAWRLQTAKKPETRQRRMAAIIDMLAQGEKLH